MLSLQNSISYKIRRVIILITTATLIVVSGSYVIFGYFSSKQAHLVRTSILAEFLAINSTAALSFESTDTANELLKSLNFDSTINRAALFTTDSRQLAVFEKPIDAKNNRGKIPTVELDTVLESLESTYYFTDNELIVYQPVILEDEPIGLVYLETNLEPLNATLINNLTTAIILFSSILAVIHSISKSIERRITRPLSSLLAGIEDVASEKNFNIRLTKQEDDEIGVLTDRFNNMLKQIHERDSELASYRDDLERQIQQRTESLVTAKEVAEKANSTKSEFLSRMSHELRTPMNAILGFGQLLQLSETLSEEDRDGISEILTAGQHLLTLINEILELSKIESGKVDIVLEAVNLHPVLHECLALVRPQAEADNISIENDIDTKQEVLADPKRLKQCLINLLSNAVKYNSKNGNVKIYSELLSENTKTRIIVQDTGSGIPEHLISQLFVPFERLGHNDYDIEGTGIGLSITQKLVKLMNGA